MEQVDFSEQEKEDLIYECGKYFRDLADEDYIAARLLFRSGFHEQYILLGQQAIEKYLKSILLYNKIKLVKENLSSKFGHELEKLFEEVHKISHIGELKFGDKYEFNRYFLHTFSGAEDIKYRVNGSSSSIESLLCLDQFVYHYRGFCRINYVCINYRSKDTDEILSKNIHRKDKVGYPYNDIGVLKKIIQSKDITEKYKNLVWKNQYWGKRKKHKISISGKRLSKNPIFFGNKELDFIAQYIYIPKGLKDVFKKEFDKFTSA